MIGGEARRPLGPIVLVMMGVTGSGKSSVGMALAQGLGWPFKEGDDLHPAANIEKMRSGIALDDSDRDGWRRERVSGVISCSALKRRYREFLDRGRPEVTFVYLESDAATLAARLAKRRGHFMPPSLLASQLDALEPPAIDEPVITLRDGGSVDCQARQLINRIVDGDGGLESNGDAAP